MGWYRPGFTHLLCQLGKLYTGFALAWKMRIMTSVSLGGIAAIRKAEIMPQTLEPETIVRTNKNPLSESTQETTADGKNQQKKQPRYHVVLWDDNDHTYNYVIRMLQSLFAVDRETGFQIAETVDTRGRAICLTTTLEHAELKRDQIRAFGKDDRLSSSSGSMLATIESEDK
jgi:ATP-dependent Clp protease adaptor protein ClpS